MSYLVHKKETFLLFASWLPTLISKKKKNANSAGVSEYLVFMLSCCLCYMGCRKLNFNCKRL